MKHLDIGGSTASRTLACPGWIKASKNIKRRPVGQAAIDGSMHHEVQEMCQKTGVTPEECLGYVYKEDGKERVFGEYDLDLSNIAYNATNDVLDTLDIDEMLIEPFVQVSPDVAGGSIDVLGLSEDGETLLVLDYKFGNHKVSAEDNAQLLFYAMCAEEDPETADLFAKVNKVVLCIIQPKIKGTVDMWATGRQHLKDFSDDMMATIEMVDDATPFVQSGSWCQWCPAAPYCRTKKQAVFAATLLDAKSHNELCEAASHLAEVEQWAKNVREELYMQLNRGVSVPGYKVVEKRATRKWVDEADATCAMEKAGIKLDVFTKSVMLTAPQTEKALKKNKIDFDLTKFIVKTSTGTTLAMESDSREAVKQESVQDAFKKMKQRK